MKKYLLFFLVNCVFVRPMQENNIVIVDGENKSNQVFSLGASDEIIKIFIEGNSSEQYEHAILSGILAMYRDLAYGLVDMRQIEQEIACAHGYKDSQFTYDHTYVFDSDRVSRSTVSTAIMVGTSKTQNPMLMPELKREQELILKSNLKNRIAVFRFLQSALNPSRSLSVDDPAKKQRSVFVSHLEHAVFAELE